MRRIFAAAVLMLAGVIAGSAAQLTVNVRNTAGASLPGALVAAIAFQQGDSSGNPIAAKSNIMLSNSAGVALFTIETGYDYLVLVSSHGMSPTIKDQMYNASLPTVRTSGADITMDRVLQVDAGLLANANGRFSVQVNDVGAGTLIFCDVRNRTTQETVAYACARTDGGGSARAELVNIVPSAAGTFMVSVGVPALNFGYDLMLDTPVVAGQPFVIQMSSTVFSVASRVERQDTVDRTLSFEGVVVGYDNAPLKDCVVTLKQKNPSLSAGQWQWENSIEVAEARTDMSGYFSFYDVDSGTYAIQISKVGFEGRFLTGSYEQGLSPERSSDRRICTESDGKVHLPAALGSLRGRVMMYTEGGSPVPVPNSYINLYPDWTFWPAVPAAQATAAGSRGYDNYYTTSSWRSANGNAQVTTKADGTFEVVGLPAGNYQLGVWNDFVTFSGDSNYYLYNNGSDQMQSGWARNSASDDLRVTISTGNPADAADWIARVFRADGAVHIANASVSTVGVFDLFIATRIVEAGTISGTITFDTPDAAVTIPDTDPINIWVYEQNGDSQQKRYYTSIAGALNGKTTDYVVHVASNTAYWVEVRCRHWGVLNRMDMGANLRSAEAVTNYNFKMARAGTIRGVVRLPDGKIFKRRSNNMTNEKIELKAQGVTSNSYGWGDVKEDGYFEIIGLVPGLYDISTENLRETSVDGTSVRTPLEWPDAIVPGVRVRALEETYLEIQLKNGTLVMPKTPTMPDLPQPADPTKEPYAEYAILKFPSSVGATRETLGGLMGKSENYEKNASFTYDASAASPWQSARILPGRYDFLLSKVDRFSGGNDESMESSDHFSVTFISKLKNVELNYDALAANTTTYLSFESGTLGQSAITGTVKGLGVFSQRDVDIIITSGLELFLTYIPSIMLYDADGQLKGFSMALPNMQRIQEWDERINNRSFTLAWLKQELAAYPLTYYVDRLPAGEYVAVFETPNYPPLMKKVRLATGANTLNVDFDSNVLAGSGLGGVVKSTDGVALADVTITLSHRTVNKTLFTDADGRFSLSGLPQGTYRMTVNKAGYAPAAEKFGLGSSARLFESGDEIVLTRANATVSGTVFTQKMPTPKVIVGAKIAAYDETYNTANPGKMLPVIAAKTDDSGVYYLDGLIAGHTYKVYVLTAGKLLEWKTIGTTANPLNVGANTGLDFVLKSLPPRLKVTMSKIYENGRFLYYFLIESPKKIINPNNPAALAAPYCRYSPVASASAAFDGSAAVEVLPNIGPEIANTDGGTTYSYSLKIPIIEDSEYYKLRVEATDGSIDYTEDILFGPKIEAKAKKDLKEELAEGGDIALDETGTDGTRITVDAGALTATGAETSTVNADNVDIPIGGFLSAMPNFNLSRTGSAKSAAMAKMVDSIVASDVYEVALNDAQMNKSLSLNLKFDIDKVADTDLPNLTICQYNSATDQWEPVSGAMTVDPINEVVSVDVESVAQAATNQQSPRAGRAQVKNGMFAVNRAAATSQSGVFAVFKQDPTTAKTYTGTAFAAFNFPNPFDLKTKNVTLQDANADVNQTITGTLIKYALPADRSGRIRMYMYNLAGELVKEIDDGDRTGGYYYYTEWDGKNENGDACASGAYFLIVKCDGKKLNDKPVKMAILK